MTIATNMAGRGTDIQLGGNLEMRIEARGPGSRRRRARGQDRRDQGAPSPPTRPRRSAAGGLYVVGTERHESRRIDNQLRGRSGRQGDPGHSKFFLSLQDDLMRIFPVESMDSMLGKLGLEQGESITHPWVTKAIERAQAKVEARNFDIRKNILKYDDVMNDQRKVIFEQRLELMDDEDVTETIDDDAPRRRRRHASPRRSPSAPIPSSGTSSSSRRRPRPISTSTCRSRPGPRRKASTSSRCASA